MSSERPEGWRLAKLGEVAALSGGTTPSKANEAYWLDGTLRWATPSDITSLPLGKSRIAATEAHITKAALEECSLKLNPPGTVLMTSRATIGYAVINDVPMATNQGCLTFTCFDDCDPDFLCQWLNANRDLLTAAAGGSTFKELSRSTAKLLPILLPPLDEQRQIAEILRSVDEACRLNGLALTHLRLLRRLALRDLFTAADGEQFVSTILGPLPHGWAAVPAEDICEAVIDCKNRTPPITETGYAVVRTPNVRDGRFVRQNLVRTDATSFEEWTRRGRPQAGDVLITREAPIGEVCAVPEDEPICLGQRMMLYRPNPAKLDSSFLLYALQSEPVQYHLRNLGGGSTVGHVRVGDIRQLPIPCPPITTQVAVAKMLTEIDVALDRAAQSVAQAPLLKSALVADLLSGRVRVSIHKATVASPDRVQPAFKRAVFAAEIVHQLHRDDRFGSVKHEKIVHLCELHLGLQDDLDRHAYKQAAGPYDPSARRSVERIFRQQKWFEPTKQKDRVVYEPLEAIGSHRRYFERYFDDRKVEVQEIIDLLRPMTTQQCEIVATLYSVWNDFLIEGYHPSDDEIVDGVLNNWTNSKRQIPGEKWHAALPWMRKKGLIPRGRGEKTRVATK